MIFYFSGTGNSCWVAQRLAVLLHDAAADMACFMREKRDFRLAAGEAVGFVFPAYGWDVPRVVRQFVAGLPDCAPAYAYLVVTCGDDTGRLLQRFRKALKGKGWGLDSAWAVRMPNTYVGLPGFDVDSEEVAAAKLRLAPAVVERIAAEIDARRRGISDVRPGAFPRTKTYLLGTLFRKFLMSPRLFRSMAQCVGCGICVGACPLQNVRLEAGRPQWGTDCTMCLSCYHHCPQHAVRYGREGRRKGQYLHP